MPAKWNGQFMGVGNGGMGGSISYQLLLGALARGYATASTNTGHQGRINDGSCALGHRKKVIDFGYRAVHEMTVVAKQLIAVTTAGYRRSRIGMGVRLAAGRR